jgi:hypothetical protein
MAVKITDSTSISIPVVISIMTVAIWLIRSNDHLEARVSANEKEIATLKRSVYGRHYPVGGDYDGE